jgi:hypothetical protein
MALGLLTQSTAFSQTEDQQNAFRAQVLASINAYRAMYVNDTALVLPASGTDVYTVLNTGSASWASYLASTSAWAHSSAAARTIASNGDVAGENIALQWTSVTLAPADVAKMAVDSWYAEKANYSYVKPLDTSVGSTGHFTQLVWISSTTVGCGYAVKPDPMNPEYNAYIEVCRFDPPGNLQDATVYGMNVPMLNMGTK